MFAAIAYIGFMVGFLLYWSMTVSYAQLRSRFSDDDIKELRKQQQRKRRGEEQDD